jgi:transcription initiation factor TFIIF subunit beta
MTSKIKTAPHIEKQLNLSTKETSLWLVKVPRFVAEKWTNAANDALLGSLNITSVAVPNGPPIRKINVNITGDGTEPEEFTLEELSTSDQQQLMAFKYHNNTESFSVEGKITKNLMLKPRGTIQYRQKVRERGIIATTRQEAKKAAHEDIQTGMSSSHVVDFIPLARAELKRKQQEQQAASKVSRTSAVLDLTELRCKLFEAFAVAERRTLKDLLGYCKDVSGVKEKDIRDMLDWYATYHTKGPYKKNWELKLEYKDHTATPAVP